MIAKFNVRWLFLALPLYGVVYLGRAGWPLIAALAAGSILYILTLEAASRRWPDWVNRHTLFLRLAEIGLACIALSLVYLKARESSIYEDFYYDGFYAVFVILAAIAGGTRGGVTAVAVATLAVAFGQVVQAPDSRAFFGPGGLEYWGSVAAYSFIYAAFFAAMAALARFALEFQTRTARWSALLRLGREVVTLQDAVLVADAQGTVTSVNPAAESLFGPAASLWGQPFAALFEASLPQETLEPMEVKARRGDGSTFEAEVSLSAYRSNRGELIARIAVVRDLTARRRADRAAARRERLASLERFAAGLARELEGPASAIAAAAESLLQSAEDKRLRSGLAGIAAEARRAADLVRDLRSFAQHDGERPVPVNLNEVVQRAVALRAFVRPAGVEVVEDRARELPRILGVPAELEQAVMNLLENAEEAVERAGGGTIRVRTYSRTRTGTIGSGGLVAGGAGESVVIEIHDSGAGIPPILLEQIFDPFFTTKGESAAGLGLAVVHGIVSRHGGVVKATSHAGAGTVVSLELPAAEPWVERLAATAPRADSA